MGDDHQPVMTSRVTNNNKTKQNSLLDDPPSIVEIRRAIPAHCFKSSLITSFYYVFKDILIISALFASTFLVERYCWTVLKCLWLPLYWVAQGTMFWAVFVLGHDCGHGSFSRYSMLNDVVGTILHTFIMVPFYPWKLSHRHHHKNTGNIDKDEIFYPIREKDSKLDHDTLFGFGLGIGWFIYLYEGYRPRPVAHWNPFESMFIKHVLGCSLSLASLVLWSGMLLWIYLNTNTLIIVSYYVIPVLVFGTWLVVVTFLHHNEAGIRWYGDEVWTNVRGQLSSVDRHYGVAHSLTHNIGTHQIHHLFSLIPHYRLEEATYHFRKQFPDLAVTCDRPIIPSFLRMFKTFLAQRHVKNDTLVHTYH